MEFEDRWRTRSRSFGAIAHEYDRVRPSYPTELIDDIAARLPGDKVAEIGAGTGKATVLFAARDLKVTAVEPDPEMAAVLTDHVRTLPNVDVVLSTYENWQPNAAYDGLLAAQSWHWTAPEKRYERAARILRPDGIIALFWNITDWPRTPISGDIDDIYRRHGMAAIHAQRLGEAEPQPWPPEAFTGSALFTDFEIRSYPQQYAYTGQEWIDLVATTSDHLTVPADRRHALLADVARLIDRSGETMVTFNHCDLYLARRTEVAVDSSA